MSNFWHRSYVTMANNLYVARRGQNRTAVVSVAGRPLDPRLDLWNHSPDGFEWGYAGSGPAQLALAILAHEYGDDFAVAWHQRFKFAVIAAAPKEGWELASDTIHTIVADMIAKANSQEN